MFGFMEKKKILISAQAWIVSTIQGRQLTDRETLKVTVEIGSPTGGFDIIRDADLTDPVGSRMIDALCNTHVRFVYRDLFVSRLRTDFALKRQIGGVRWSVEVGDVTWVARDGSTSPTVRPPDRDHMTDRARHRNVASA
jgi:hypothetical protein